MGKKRSIFHRKRKGKADNSGKGKMKSASYGRGKKDGAK